MYYVNATVNLMVENVIQIKNGTIKIVCASVNNMYVRKDYIWNPATCSGKNGYILLTIHGLPVIKL